MTDYASKRQVQVSFAWNEDDAVTIEVGVNQTLRDAIASSGRLPAGMSSDLIGIIDVDGNDMTNVRGGEINNNTRVIVNQRGVVVGGCWWETPCLTLQGSSS